MIFVHKIKTGIKTLEIIKNWFTFILDSFGFVNRESITYRLRNGIKYIVKAKTIHRYMITETWLHRLYTKEFDINDTDIVVDIGASIGIFTVFASCYAKSGVIYAFEPESESFKLLRENIKINNIDNINLVNKAISGRTGRRDFYITNPGGHSFYGMGGGTKTTVQTISLEDFFKENKLSKIDFLKMDCEGGEYTILFNCPRNVLKNINKIAMEYHDIDKARNGHMLKKFLQDNGFKVKKSGSKIGFLYATN